MKINVKYDKSDWKDFELYLHKKICKSIRSWYDGVVFNLILWALISVVFYLVIDSELNFDWNTAVLVSLLFVYLYVMMILQAKKLRKAYQPSDKGTFVGEHEFILSDDGMSVSGKDYNSFYRWSSVKQLEQTETAIYVFIDSVKAFIFPISQLENIVRIKLKEAGAITSSVSGEGIENENGLSSLIELPECTEIFGDDTVFEISAIFTDSIGPNLRNEVAHGLLDDYTASSFSSIYAWWMVLRMILNSLHG